MTLGITTISPADKRRALLQQMRRDGGSATAPVSLPPIPRRDPDRPVPLTFSQERLWFLDRLALGSAFYAESSAVHIATAIEPARLERAINAIVQRHEVLRACFDEVDGRPVQRAIDGLHVPLVVEDLSALAPALREQQIERIAVEHAMQPFDLRQPPLLRTRLLLLGNGESVFLLTVHHILSDGWSMGIFSREVSACYTAYGDGQEPKLPPLALQYFDHAAWQRASADGAAGAAQLAWWCEKLQGLPVLKLPLDHPRPRLLNFAGAQLDVAIPANLSAGLRALCRREQATLFAAALAVFAALLHVETGQTDIVVGTPVAGRSRPELEALIGVFLNTQVLRLDVSGDPSFRELLRRVAQTSIAAFERDEVPFERLVEALQPERDLGRNPLFQVLFHCFTPPDHKAGAALSQPATVSIDRGTAILDLSWHLWDTPDGLRGRIEFSTELFERATIERQFQRYLRLLADALARPDRALSDMTVLSAAERQQLLVDWQGPDRHWPPSRLLPSAWVRRVADTPDALALVDSDGHFTYADMARRADGLARGLQAMGVRRGDRVAVCLPRSAATLAAALAIMRLGAAYVPLDPAYPQVRLQFILEDSRAQVLVSDRAHALRAAPGSLPMLWVDDPLPVDANDSISLVPADAVDELDVAYIVYTSGSTGRPKGVAGLHGATRNRFEWMFEAYPWSPGEVACQRTALSFVDSIWESFGPLLAGVPLIVVPDDTARDMQALVDLLAQRHITRLLVVPSLLSALLDAGIDLATRLPTLRLWFSSGERLAVDLVQRFASALPQATLVNLYGSSEAAGDILHDVVSGPGARAASNGNAQSRVAIGCSIANSRAYVMDASLRLLPPGTPGELYVAGPNLARGYLGQPGLTAERFLPDPHATEPGARMYATGDRARHGPDGRLEYLGRCDQQVKLRGHRVELGEIELVLQSYPGVLDAAATVHDDGAGGRLVACVVWQSAQQPPEALRAFVAERLPAAMVPGAVLALDALPRTPNGKLDRKALPVTAATAPTDVERPATEAELALAAIFGELLRTDPVAATDNFFDLGGHSLLAIRLVSRVRSALAVDLSLREVFLHPTVAELALVIEERLLDDIERLSDDEVKHRLAVGDLDRAGSQAATAADRNDEVADAEPA